MNFRQWLRAVAGEFILSGEIGATARFSQRHAFSHEFPISDIRQDYIIYLQEHPYPDDNQVWDHWALYRAWNEFKRLETAQELV